MPNADRPTLVIVTGSGRSGTSSVAGALQRFGYKIPQPEVETDERNPLGYYEPLWVAEFHKHLLNPIPVRTIDSRPNAGEIAMAAVTPELEAELRTWLSAELDHPVVVVKETRAYWVYPMWTRIAADLDVPITSLTMLRHPTQVVRSRDAAYLTEATDSFRRQRETTNVAAWMNSVFVTEAATRANPRAFVTYDDLVGDWRAALTRATAQLGLDPGDLAGHHPVDDFITPTLNRSAATWEGLMVAPTLVDLAERTWSAAASLVEDPAGPEPRRALDELHAEYTELYESSAAIALDETTAQVASVRRNLRARIENKERRIKRLRAELDALQGRT